MNVIRVCLRKMHRAMYYDPLEGHCVSNVLIGMQIGTVWKMTMRALREVVRFGHVTRTAQAAPCLFLRRPFTVARGRRHEKKKNLSWIYFFHANGHGNKVKRRNSLRMGIGRVEGVHRLKNRTDLFIDILRSRHFNLLINAWKLRQNCVNWWRKDTCKKNRKKLEYVI